MAEVAKSTGAEVHITTSEENSVQEKTATVVAVSEDEKEASNLQADDDDTEYVKGHPIIKNGMDVSKYLISTKDDGDPAFTFRSIVLGTLFTALSSVITMLYQFKPVQIQVSAVFLQLLIFIFGEAWAIFTPRPERFNGTWVRSLLSFLNFGQPFGIKEHVVAALIASSGNNGLAGVDVYAVERYAEDAIHRWNHADFQLGSSMTEACQLPQQCWQLSQFRCADSSLLVF